MANGCDIRVIRVIANDYVIMVHLFTDGLFIIIGREFESSVFIL